MFNLNTIVNYFPYFKNHDIGLFGLSNLKNIFKTNYLIKLEPFCYSDKRIDLFSFRQIMKTEQMLTAAKPSTRCLC